MSQSQPNVINKQTLQDLIETVHDKQFVKDLMIQYIGETPRLMTMLQRAIDAKDTQAIIIPTHCIKSSSSILGATKLAKKCAQLELKCRRGDTKGLKTMYQYIDQSQQQVTQTLHHLLQEL